MNEAAETVASRTAKVPAPSVSLPRGAGDGAANGHIESNAAPAAPAASVDSDSGRAETTATVETASARGRRSLLDRLEASLSRLSTRNHFWQRMFSMIWLPYAFRSGIKMKRIDATTFTAVLPFRRFNRNWYNAMAGASLLANSEIAGGHYVFGICGGDYTVVCKTLEYRFLRPCYGPALYRITPREDIQGLLAAGREFNLTIDLDVVQQIGKPGSKERRVGKCTAVFHATPKTHNKAKRKRGESAE